MYQYVEPIPVYFLWKQFEEYNGWCKPITCASSGKTTFYRPIILNLSQVVFQALQIMQLEQFIFLDTPLNFMLYVNLN